MNEPTINRNFDRERIFTSACTAILILIVAAFVFLPVIVSCSDSDDNDKKTSSSEIAHCQDTVGAINECFDISDVMGMSYSDALAQCSEGDFDDYDKCFFACEDKSTDCDVFADCLDGC